SLRTRDEVATEVAEIVTPAPPQTPFTEAALQMQWEMTQAELNNNRHTLRLGGLLCRESAVTNYRNWWLTFFYRFVGGEQRVGTHANYVSRLRNAREWVLPYAVVFPSPSPTIARGE